MCRLFVLLSLALCASLSAQVVARQGSPAESPLQEFKSPMVLDLPLADFPALAFGTGRDFKEVRKFYCEDQRTDPSGAGAKTDLGVQ
ncbi:MAG TPA: hypothetical protein VGG03_19130 [Thermoanaerobaculia bacterium]